VRLLTLYHYEALLMIRTEISKMLDFRIPLLISYDLKAHTNFALFILSNVMRTALLILE